MLRSIITLTAIGAVIAVSGCASQQPVSAFDRFERCMNSMNVTYMSATERFQAAQLCSDISGAQLLSTTQKVATASP